MGFPGDSVVKNPPAKQETWVRSLGREDPLDKAMATYSSILAWDTPWAVAYGVAKRVRHNLAAKQQVSIIGFPGTCSLLQLLNSTVVLQKQPRTV